ncbi:uncharacterized protein LOC106141276 [Amyelois transitella]|uniref:uncharacterized protein LOC106141276 n=1 Tax=Amyelois transitella TaxID=680683 RepID=UPI00067D5691|nr:uncharacterized protein LOC106141276 [Amyelois transitella]
MSSQRYRSFYSANSEKKQNWKCPECISKVPKQGNLTTPVRTNVPVSADSHNSTSPSSDSQNVTVRSKVTKTPVSIESISNDDIDYSNMKSCMKTLAEEMQAMRKDIGRMCDKIDTFTETISTRVNLLEARIDSLESKKSEVENKKIKDLEGTVLQLKLKLQEREQEALGNDIELASFPEVKNENTTHLVLAVAKKLGVELEERDVVNAQRAGPVPAAVEGGAPARPRPLVVRLARRATRDGLLRAARVRRGVTTEGIVVAEHGSPRSFYVNERLTKPNRHLFLMARQAAKRSNWKYVWTKDGKIYARREQGRASFRLCCETDIQKVFGDSCVRSDPQNMQ